MKRPENSPAIVYYKALKEHIESDIVDIYTIVAVLLKDYTIVEGIWYQVFKVTICFLAQTLLPVFVIYDSIQTMRVETSGPCPNTGTWQDRASGCVMSLFLLIFFFHRWAPFTYRLFDEYRGSTIGDEPRHQAAGIIGILFTRELNMYMSEAAFTWGVFAKLMVHCLTTLSCIFVILQSVGCIDIIVNATAMYYLSDVSVMVLDDYLKERTLWYLKRRHKLVIQDSMLFENADLDTTLSIIDHRMGLVGLACVVIFTCLLTPVLFMATLGAVIYVPWCHS